MKTPPVHVEHSGVTRGSVTANSTTSRSSWRRASAAPLTPGAGARRFRELRPTVPAAAG